MTNLMNLMFKGGYIRDSMILSNAVRVAKDSSIYISTSELTADRLVSHNIKTVAIK
jgi:hypothetical protein